MSPCPHVYNHAVCPCTPVLLSFTTIPLHVVVWWGEGPRGLRGQETTLPPLCSNNLAIPTQSARSGENQDMLHKKLHDFLVKGDLCGYRLLLSRQHAWLRKCKVAPVPALLATSDAKTDFQGMVEEFLLQYLCFEILLFFLDANCRGPNNSCSQESANWKINIERTNKKLQDLTCFPYIFLGVWAG